LAVLWGYRMMANWKDGSGCELIHSLPGHSDVVLRLTWAPDGETIASTSVDRTIRLWNRETGTIERVLSGHHEGVNEVAWGPGRTWIGSASFDRSIRIWDLSDGQCITELRGHGDDVSSISLSPDAKTLASGSADRTIRLWCTDAWQQTQTIDAHKSDVYRVAWSPDGRSLASCSKDRSVTIWQGDQLRVLAKRTFKSRPSCVAWSRSGKLWAASSFDGVIHIEGPERRVLEGHTDTVRSITFSYDDRLLASSSLDGTVRLWRTDSWEQVTQFGERVSGYWPQGIAFHPNKAILATFGEEDRIVRLWKIDVDRLVGAHGPHEQVTYRNAKILLLGDTGVGKTGLRLVLTGQPFAKETRLPSTFGRRVFPFDAHEVDEHGRKEHREALLWDMAGQPAYRLVHQLHLNEVTVALVVCDARQAVGDPLAGVRHWARALRQASQIESDLRTPLKAFLVWGRADVQGLNVSMERIEAVKREWGFAQFFETSAADGRGIQELTAAIRDAIAWDTLPAVSSPKLFEKLKTFLIREKSTGRILVISDDLFRSFHAAHPEEAQTANLKDTFDTCVSRLENGDLLRQLTFGRLVLLQPELLDVYASAMVVASGESGALAEEDVLAGHFRMPANERLQDRNQEKFLLIATVEEMVQRQLVLREKSPEGAYLVFPSQFNREWPQATEPTGKEVIVRFQGPVQNIYATLAVRLSHSGIFRTSRAAMWRNAAVFEADTGGECGFHLREIDDGAGELALFFGRQPFPSPETRYRFEAFVLSHLAKTALAGSVAVERLFVCQSCGNPVPRVYVELRRAAGENWFACPCGGTVSLIEPREQIEAEREAVRRMELKADRERSRGAGALTMRGKEELDEYDVFLCYNSADRDTVVEISEKLNERSIRPWLDVAVLRPGDVWMKEIETVIAKVKCAVVFIGPRQLGESQEIEMRGLVRRFVDHSVRVIPAILRGAEIGPQWSLYLDDFHRVDFRVPRPDPMAELLYGITGVRLGPV
jgi:WD40 repeat protein